MEAATSGTTGAVEGEGNGASTEPHQEGDGLSLSGVLQTSVETGAVNEENAENLLSNADAGLGSRGGP